MTKIFWYIYLKYFSYIVPLTWQFRKDQDDGPLVLIQDFSIIIDCAKMIKINQNRNLQPRIFTKYKCPNAFHYYLSPSSCLCSAYSVVWSSYSTIYRCKLVQLLRTPAPSRCHYVKHSILKYLQSYGDFICPQNYY